MPRKTIAAAEHTGPMLATVSPPSIIADATNLALLEEHLSQTAVTAPFSVEHRVALYISSSQQCQSALLIMGACLCDLREHIDDGAFLETLDHLGLNARTAQRQMQIFRAFGKGQRMPFALGKSANLLLELSRIDDANLDEMLESGELDELDKLPRKELKKRISALQKQADTDKELIETKDRKFNDLDRELRTWARTPATEKALKILQDASLAEGRISAACCDFEVAVRAALLEAGDAPAKEVTQRIRDLCAQVRQYAATCAAIVGD